MHPSVVEITALVFFIMAVVHTFLSSRFKNLAHRFAEGSIPENFFHLLGEVEVVFGLWAAFFVLTMAILAGTNEAISYAESRDFTEPLFVFAVMVIAATKPIIDFAQAVIVFCARILPIGKDSAVFCSCLIVGPLLGSFITEPAAMTLTALILKEHYFGRKFSEKFKYVALATLFVNVSIGGVLTPYAAPPVLMVATKWNWNLSFMFSTFGWKSIIAVILNSLLAWLMVRGEFKLHARDKVPVCKRSPKWLVAIHFVFLALVVLTAHHAVIFLGLFLLFLGVTAITTEYQDELKLKQSLLVGFFLGGLVVLGGVQRWWLEPVLQGMPHWALFLGTTGLTAFADNAALTYLGSQIDGVSEAFKLSLMGGAIVGGGLTVIANAPNPAGYAILQDSFGPDGIGPFQLFFYALLPTIISAVCLWPYS